MDYQSQKRPLIHKRLSLQYENDLAGQNKSLLNHRNHIIRNAATKMNESSSNNKELLDILKYSDSKTDNNYGNTSVWYKHQFGEQLEGTDERNACDTPLERTNMNVYFWYYHNKGPYEKSLKSNTSEKRVVKMRSNSETFVANENSFINQFKFKTEKTQLTIHKPSLHTKIQIPERRRKAYRNSFFDSQEVGDAKNRRILLNTAAIKHMPISDKFKKQVKGMVFVPKYKSFYPKQVDHILKSVI